jgi:hypothetical protein
MTDELKFTRTDARYLAGRKVVSEQYGSRELWSVIDHWPLYAGIANIARALAVYEILKRQATVPGDLAEFGSWRGANLMFMAKVMNILEPMCGKQVHCFESFEGLTEFRPEDLPNERARGIYKGSMAELQDLIELYELQGTIRIHKGLIEEQLPAFLKAYPGTTLSLVYFDADLYSAAIMVLRGCHDRLAKGGVFVLDEWNYPNWPGEGTAVREFMADYGDQYEMEHVPHTRSPTLILRKI